MAWNVQSAAATAAAADTIYFLYFREHFGLVISSLVISQESDCFFFISHEKVIFSIIL